MAQPIDPRLPHESRVADPRQLRPRRRWYGIAGAVVVLFIVLAIGGSLVSLYAMGRAEVEFYSVHETAGQDVRVRVKASNDYGIYVPKGATGSCTVDSDVVSPYPPGTGTAKSYSHSGESWRMAASFHAFEDGTVIFRCSAAPAAFGGSQETTGFRLAVGGLGASVACLPCLGVTVGGAIALGTWLRRSSHKKRLLTNPHA
ncbi:hypothetical protein [Cryptosporangium aurantiacum]|uniref:Uncharacterized protein n=1 Tax=Cryptosporangium aurantiacum TaxID=134849 RepID=A0A1M7RIZ2_9ACTN|nr:hypothetical protein [Cryptosporangium aurantiacum]SHN46305.1 hypothetical protein SAMN05443668_114139 [Cryptosporangium aurantiacum]